jgi:hypothetical protein
MNEQLPQRLPLNGSDYFQLFLDRHHRATGPLGNVSRFAVYLDKLPDPSALESHINGHPLLCWLHNLRLKTGWPFQLPRWQQKQGPPVAIPLRLFMTDLSPRELPEIIWSTDLRAKSEAPFRFDLVSYSSGQAALVFSWNHILMDARGAELLVRQLGLPNTDAQYFAPPEPPLPLMESLQHARKVKDFLLDGTRIKPALLTGRPTRERNCFHIIDFTAAESRQVEANCQKYLARFGKSPVLLAATLRAYQHILDGTASAEQQFWVPIPQDQRRKGVAGPVIGNQVSYLFYRLRSPHLGGLQTAVDEISAQMVSQMRAGIPKSYHIMMELVRRMPLGLYSYITKSPTQGMLASLFFSDTGHTLDDFTDFAGCAVTDAIHYPPSAGIPGFTTIFMSVQNRLRAVIGYTADSAGADKPLRFERFLRNDLLGL